MVGGQIGQKGLFIDRAWTLAEMRRGEVGRADRSRENAVRARRRGVAVVNVVRKPTSTTSQRFGPNREGKRVRSPNTRYSSHALVLGRAGRVCSRAKWLNMASWHPVGQNMAGINRGGSNQLAWRREWQSVKRRYEASILARLITRRSL